MSKKVIIIGGGPAGLFAAYELLKRGHEVCVYDQSSGPGKKFLVAGNSGLNLTHSEDIDKFASRYGKDEKYFLELLNDFNSKDLMKWAKELGTQTFIGSSGRVFPVKMKAAEILSKWLSSLKNNSKFSLYLKHSLKSVSQTDLCFEENGNQITVSTEDAEVIFAMGGGSWKKTGSDGLWVKSIESLGIKVAKLTPMNCGFERQWSDFFKKKYDRFFLKNVVVFNQSKTVSSRGEVMITDYGIEGGAVYAISNTIRDEIYNSDQSTIYLDLKPDLSIDEVRNKLGELGKSSISSLLTKKLKLDKSVYTLLCEVSQKSSLSDLDLLSNLIKALPISVHSTRPIDEAISTSGGVEFSELTQNLNSKKIPHYYFIGEMLDFEAPTGGYLLQGCFSTAWRVVQAISGERNV